MDSFLFIPPDNVLLAVLRLLSRFNTNQRNTASKTLSDGMKRKLSIGIALIAGSKVCIKPTKST
jgi:ABC-type multidrug transport system ATPase subunit